MHLELFWERLKMPKIGIKAAIKLNYDSTRATFRIEGKLFTEAYTTSEAQ
jgi:hypothetical protein